MVPVGMFEMAVLLEIKNQNNYPNILFIDL